MSNVQKGQQQQQQQQQVEAISLCSVSLELLVAARPHSCRNWIGCESPYWN